MAIKNFWSLEPGEAIFAEELHKKFKDKINVYFPLKDTGIDLLAVSRSSNKTVSFQVKESRYYEDKNTSWHQETKEKIQNNKNKVDFYVFLIYLPGHMAGTKKKSLFEKLFIIIPTRDLIERVKIKKTVKSGKYNKYSFYFRLQGESKKVIDVREIKNIQKRYPKLCNYSDYLDAWGLIGRKF